MWLCHPFTPSQSVTVVCIQPVDGERVWSMSVPASYAVQYVTPQFKYLKPQFHKSASQCWEVLLVPMMSCSQTGGSTDLGSGSPGCRRVWGDVILQRISSGFLAGQQQVKASGSLGFELAPLLHSVVRADHRASPECNVFAAHLCCNMS